MAPRLFLVCAGVCGGVDYLDRSFLLRNRGRFAYQLIPAHIEVPSRYASLLKQDISTSIRLFEPSFLLSHHCVLCRGGHIMARECPQHTIDNSRLEHRC